MPKTYVNVIRKDAQIKVPFTCKDVAAYQAILLRHITGEARLDEKSFQVIEDLCSRIDFHAEEQNLTEPKAIEF
jgi:hypothetical protein